MSDKNEAPLDKVVAFVLGGEHQLLVFEHPTAGLQLPKGTVEPGESLENAVRREVYEETGIELGTDGVLLGDSEQTLDAGRVVIVETTRTDDATFFRGRYVDVLEQEPNEGRVRIREEHLDYAQSPPQVIRSAVGHVPVDCVSDRVRHTFFLFRAAHEGSDSWSREADGHTFTVSWRALDEVELHARQQEWLNAYRERFGAESRHT